MNEVCMWCDNPATRYCDAPIGFEAVGAIRNKSGNVTALLAGTEKMWTCDAPMCDEHAKQIGWVCGSEPDSVDRCPHHADEECYDMEKLVIFESEALEKRREVHALIRRKRMVIA